MTDPAARIIRLDLYPYAVPLARPWTSARGATTERAGWLVRIEDAEGAVGWGECAPLPGAGTESPEAAAGALAEALDRLPGLRPRAGLEALPATSTPAARFGVEAALLDMLARRAGQPLYRYLRATADPEVPVNAFGGAVDAGLAGRLTEAAEAGFRVVKLKLATRPAEEELAALETLARLPRADGAWRLDVNRGWDLATAREAWPRLARLPIEAVEEPARDATGRELATLQDQAPFAVALDESLGNWPAGEPLPVRRQVLKPMVVGGPRAALALAGRPDTQSVVTSSVETATGLWHAAHLAAAVGGGLAHGLDTGSWLTRLLGPALPIRRGLLVLGDAPGIGFDPELP